MDSGRVDSTRGTVILNLPGQGEAGFSMPDPARPELVHTRAGLALPLDRVLFETERQRRRGAILLGETGSGKTTFLTTLDAGVNVPAGLARVRIDVPRDGDPACLRAAMAGSAGPRLFIVDGLDEIQDPDRRREFAEALKAAEGGSESDRWIVASRYAEYEPGSLGGRFAEFHMRPMRVEKVQELVRQFCEKARIPADELIRALGASERRSRSCVFTSGFPGQLSLLCRAWARDGKLPVTREELQALAREIGESERVVSGLGGWRHLGDPTMPDITSDARPTDSRTGLMFVTLPGGRFVMGSPDDEEGRWTDEGPRHKVDVPPFELAVTPVTNLQYERYLDANPDARVPAYWGDPRFNRDHQPVVGVWWEDAKAYAMWAGVRLPSESEWEYACRAGVDAPRYGPLDDIAWWMGNSNGILHSVGTREPNGFGLHDMIGNVWEYVEDDRHDRYDGAPADGSAWIDDPRGEVRLLRGGTWSDAPRVVRCTSRLTHHPGPRIGNVGFRVARSV